MLINLNQLSVKFTPSQSVTYKIHQVMIEKPRLARALRDKHVYDGVRVIFGLPIDPLRF